MLVSATRLRVRSIVYLPIFVWRTYLIQRQVVRSPGIVGGRLLVDAKRTFWTLTGWEGEEAMRGFRGAGAHGKVMSRLSVWCDEASVVHWFEAGTELPGWIDVFKQMRKRGRPSRVNQPSPGHETVSFPDARMASLVSLDLRPAIK